MRGTILAALLLLSPLSMPADEGARPVRRAAARVDDFDSLAAEYRHLLSGLTSPALEKRKSDRRRVQRGGYSGVLSEVVRRDGLGALLAYARMRLQLEFSLPNDVLIAYIPLLHEATLQDSLSQSTTFGSRLYAVPLIEDRSFPPDPWGTP